MIRTKKDLKEYIEADLKNNYLRKKFKFFDVTRKYLILLRTTEYHINNKHKLRVLFCKWRFSLLSNKLLTFIPYNSFNKGLSIGHFGCIYVNPATKVGENCRINEMVNIGATNGSKNAPILGNNVYIGSGAKIIGDISIASDVAIGAGTVVVKDIAEPNTTWGGVPAKKISDNGSHSNLKIFSEIEEKKWKLQ